MGPLIIAKMMLDKNNSPAWNRISQAIGLATKFTNSARQEQEQETMEAQNGLV